MIRGVHAQIRALYGLCDSPSLGVQQMQVWHICCTVSNFLAHDSISLLNVLCTSFPKCFQTPFLFFVFCVQPCLVLVPVVKTGTGHGHDTHDTCLKLVVCIRGDQQHMGALNSLNFSGHLHQTLLRLVFNILPTKKTRPTVISVQIVL